MCYRSADAHIDSAIIALDAKAKDNTPTDKNGEGDKNADWARRMELYLGTLTNKIGAEIQKLRCKKICLSMFVDIFVVFEDFMRSAKVL
jgi:hypothetical protein